MLFGCAVNINEIYPHFPVGIRAIRKKAGDSQTAFGSAFGVSKNTVNNWERGKVIPSPDNLVNIKNICGVQLEWLLYGEEYSDLGLDATQIGIINKVRESPEIARRILDWCLEDFQTRGVVGKGVRAASSTSQRGTATASTEDEP